MSQPVKCEYCNLDVHVRRVDDDRVEFYCPKCGRYEVYRVVKIE